MSSEHPIEKVTLAVCRDCGGVIDAEAWEWGVGLHRRDNCPADDAIIGATFVRADDVVAALEDIHLWAGARNDDGSLTTTIDQIGALAASLKEGQDA